MPFFLLIPVWLVLLLIAAILACFREVRRIGAYLAIVSTSALATSLPAFYRCHLCRHSFVRSLQDLKHRRGVYRGRIRLEHRVRMRYWGWTRFLVRLQSRSEA